MMLLAGVVLTVELQRLGIASNGVMRLID